MAKEPRKLKEIGKIFLLVTAGMLLILLVAWNLGDKMKEQVLEQSEYLKHNEEDGAVFRDTIDSALQYGINRLDPNEKAPNYISTLIKQLENDRYVLIFYLTDYGDDEAAFAVAKLEKSGEQLEKYRCISSASSTFFKTGDYKMDIENEREIVKNFIMFSRENWKLDISSQNKQLVWGIGCNPLIFTLKIEGQEPTEIIEFDLFGRKGYLWYYEDMLSDKPYDEWEIFLEE